MVWLAKVNFDFENRISRTKHMSYIWSHGSYLAAGPRLTARLILSGPIFQLHDLFQINGGALRPQNELVLLNKLIKLFN